jgi:RimJ/RimL family protein N-acetyltransferase
MNLKFVPVEEKDCSLLFEWANDKTVRAGSFNVNPIQYNKHVKWFESKLVSNNSIFLIVKLGNLRIGQIRIEIEKKEGILNFSLSQNYRGKGYGTEILMKISKYLKNTGIAIRKLIGRVKFDNFASQKAFEKAYFVKIKKPSFYEYEKEI